VSLPNLGLDVTDVSTRPRGVTSICKAMDRIGAFGNFGGLATSGAASSSYTTTSTLLSASSLGTEPLGESTAVLTSILSGSIGTTALQTDATISISNSAAKKIALSATTSLYSGIQPIASPALGYLFNP
jgi:hypothetical protein